MLPSPGEGGDGAGNPLMKLEEEFNHLFAGRKHSLDVDAGDAEGKHRRMGSLGSLGSGTIPDDFLIDMKRHFDDADSPLPQGLGFSMRSSSTHFLESPGEAPFKGSTFFASPGQAPPKYQLASLLEEAGTVTTGGGGGGGANANGDLTLPSPGARPQRRSMLSPSRRPVAPLPDVRTFGNNGGDGGAGYPSSPAPLTPMTSPEAVSPADSMASSPARSAHSMSPVGGASSTGSRSGFGGYGRRGSITDDVEDEDDGALSSPGDDGIERRHSKWLQEEDERLEQAVRDNGEANWKAIAKQVGTKDHTQCLQRWKRVLHPGLKKGRWTPAEDARLVALVSQGFKNWVDLSKQMPGRTSKQCRERWCHHLDPNVKKGEYEEAEDRLILDMQERLGNRWAQIAQMLPGRTENAVKIRWKAIQRSRQNAKSGKCKAPLVRSRKNTDKGLRPLAAYALATSMSRGTAAPGNEPGAEVHSPVTAGPLSFCETATGGSALVDANGHIVWDEQSTEQRRDSGTFGAAALGGHSSGGLEAGSDAGSSGIAGGSSYMHALPPMPLLPGMAGMDVAAHLQEQLQQLQMANQQQQQQQAQQHEAAERLHQHQLQEQLQLQQQQLATQEMRTDCYPQQLQQQQTHQHFLLPSPHTLPGNSGCNKNFASDAAQAPWPPAQPPAREISPASGAAAATGSNIHLQLVMEGGVMQLAYHGDESSSSDSPGNGDDGDVSPEAFRSWVEDEDYRIEAGAGAEEIIKC